MATPWYTLLFAFFTGGCYYHIKRIINGSETSDSILLIEFKVIDAFVKKERLINSANEIIFIYEQNFLRNSTICVFIELVGKLYTTGGRGRVKKMYRINETGSRHGFFLSNFL